MSGFNSGGTFTPATGAITAFSGQVIASATWNTINAISSTAFTQLGTVILATRAANLVFSGPSSGTVAATATFRSLVVADIPSGLSYVTSVAQAMPSMFTVTGSPVTTSGTLTSALATQLGNLVFASSSAGATAAPTFRALVYADLPVPAAIGIGTDAIIKSTSGTVVPGGTLSAGSFISWTDGGTIAAGAAISGTWVNYSGATLALNYSGLCRRTA